MVIDEIDRVVPGDRFQLVIENVGQQSPRKLDRAEAWVSDAVIRKNTADLEIQKTHVKSGVVCDQHRIADKAEKIGRDLGKKGRVRDHGIADARELRNEWRNRHLRIDERLKFARELAVSHPVCANLGNSARRTLGARSLEVED